MQSSRSTDRHFSFFQPVFADVVSCPEEVQRLYRGVSKNHLTTHFHLGVILGGQFALNLPEILNISTISNHLNTNMRESSNYLLSFSKSEAYAASLGQDEKNYFEIDTGFFKKYIVDVQASYALHQYTFRARLLPEKECVALAVLNCSIIHITLEGNTIFNPFYIPTENLTEALMIRFKALYLAGIALARNYYETAENTAEIENYVRDLLNFYHACFEEMQQPDPFQLTLADFRTNHPEYAEHFEGQFPSETIPLMQDKTLETIAGLHAQEAIHDMLETSRKRTIRKHLNSREDPYASCGYD